MTRDYSHFDCSEAHSGCRALRRDSVERGVADPDNLPYMFCPPGAKTAVLLVHGFTATPWEMRPLASYLAESGVASLAVCLPGHGTSPEDLARCCWEEWLQAVRDGFRVLEKNFPSVYGMGLSTGNLLLLMMARESSLRGLVLFSPYLRVLHRLAPFAGWLRWLRPFHEKPLEEGEDNHYYSRRPLAGVHQINRLLQTVRRQLPQINCPVMAFNAEGDQTVDIESGRQLVDLLGSTVKVHARYGPGAPHVLTSDGNPYRMAMFALAASFIQTNDKPNSARESGSDKVRQPRHGFAAATRNYR
jgi:carboxylesterase